MSRGQVGQEGSTYYAKSKKGAGNRWTQWQRVQYMQSPEDRAMYKEVKEASVSLEPRESEARTVREL